MASSEGTSSMYQKLEENTPSEHPVDETTILLQAEKRLFRSLGGEGRPQSHDGSGSTARTLGTIQGVFAPVVLSMFGSILFLRMGFILGNAGLLEAILQFVIAYVILFATTFSVCAIATNGAVEGGGIYFMISRTLGPEFGGSIGILSYITNCVSSALHATAFVEGITENFGPGGSMYDLIPSGGWWNFLYASIINAIELGVCLVGAGLFGRATMIVFVGVLSATFVIIASFFNSKVVYEAFVYNRTEHNVSSMLNTSFHGFSSTNSSIVEEVLMGNLYPKYEYDCSGAGVHLDFFSVFGVLFSGVTGIMSGVHMSGELKSPSKNIPQGTLTAVTFTFLTFIILVLFTSLTCDYTLLERDCNYLSTISVWPPIVTIGVLLATFSSSLSHLIGASRTINAVAKDFMFGPFLAFLTKGIYRDNPIAAVFLSWLIVQLFLFMGGLNHIAQLGSVMSLLAYSAVNLACLGLELASAPNFRPLFKHYSWHTSLVGLIGSTVMMFFISPVLSAVGILLCLSIIMGLHTFSPLRKENWGSISQALIFHQVRKYLLLLDPRKSHVKFWRPQMLLLVKNPRTSCALIDFVNTLKKGGLYVIGNVEVGHLEDAEVDPCLQQYSHWLGLIDHLKVKAFVELTVSPTVRQGVAQLIRISGIGAMKPNTVLIGFHDETFRADDFASPFSPFATNQFGGAFPPARKPAEDKLRKKEYVGMILDCLKLRKNIGICRHFQSLNKGNLFSKDRQSIFGTKTKKKLYLDVWLIDFFGSEDLDISDTTSLFLLQLACIVHMVPRWKTRTLRVFYGVRSNEEALLKEHENRIQQMLELLRIKAVTKVFPWTFEYVNVPQANIYVRNNSEETAVVFLYLPVPPTKEEDEYLDQLTHLTSKWPPTIMIRGISPVTSTTL